MTAQNGPRMYEIFGATLVFLTSFTGLILALQEKSWFENYFVVEDGPVETATVIVLLSLALLSLKRFILLKNEQNNFFLFIQIFLFLLFIFGAGEEITWGQRILNFEGFSILYNNNTQQENSFHNLIIYGVPINKLIFGKFLGIVVGFYLLIMPILFRRIPKIRRLITRMGLPVPRQYQTMTFILFFILVSCIPNSKRGEVLEFGSTLLFLLIFLNPINYQLFQPKSSP